MRKIALILCVLLLLPLGAHAAQTLQFETGSMLPLKNGDTGKLVSAVQQRLIDLGFAYGLPDEQFGKRTTEAVKWVQRYLNTLPGYKLSINGVVDEALYALLVKGGFPLPTRTVSSKSSSDDVRRLQRRLILLGYLNSDNGQYTTKTIEAVKQFQARNGLTVDGIGGTETLAALYAATAVGIETPAHEYMVYVNIATQRVFVYGWDGQGYRRLVKTMLCSSGKPGSETITGIYATTEHCGEWYYFGAFNVWAKYAIRIRGPYLFHSTLFSQRSDSAVQNATVRALGSKDSHGCVRMAVSDIDWLYHNTQTGFTVVLY